MSTERTRQILAVSAATKGFMPDDEGEALRAAAAGAATEGPEPLLEVGAYCGKSTLLLAAGVLEGSPERPGTPNLVYSLDHHRGSEENQAGWEHHDPSLVDPATGLIDTLPLWRRSLHEAGADDLVAGLVGESARVAAAWTTPLRLVFIDGGHGEDPSWADYRGWAPHVIERGMLVIHDVFPDPRHGGRPPFEIYSRALESGAFEEDEDASVGSLRVLRRVAQGI